MKKIHLALLIAAAVTAITSVYSLAAINQTYKIVFEWFSEYNGAYSAEKRDVSRDKWLLDKPEAAVKLAVLPDLQTIENELEPGEFNGKHTANIGLGQYLLVYGSLGKVSSPEYRIKISDIAQRGDVVEVLVSMNSPVKPDEKPETGENTYTATDIVRINKNSFPIKGKLLFIFKNQDGTTLGEQYCEIR